MTRWPGQLHQPDHSSLDELVLVPGASCDHRLYRHQVEALSPHTQIHVVDTTRHARIETLAAEVLSTLPERFALAGLSQGGLIALEMIKQAPERVTRLALLDTLPGPGLRSDAVLHRLAIAMISLRMFPVIDTIMWPRYVHPDRLDDVDLRRLVGRMLRATGVRGLINQQRIFITRPDYRPVLPGITVPTLVLVGVQDSMAPPQAARATAAAVPGATWVVIPDAGHLTSLESPGRVTEELTTWLSSAASKPLPAG